MQRRGVVDGGSTVAARCQREVVAHSGGAEWWMVAAPRCQLIDYAS